MQFSNFDQKVQVFSWIRIFTDYYLAISKTNAIPTKASNSIPYSASASSASVQCRAFQRRRTGRESI